MRRGYLIQRSLDAIYLLVLQFWHVFRDHCIHGKDDFEALYAHQGFFPLQIHALCVSLFQCHVPTLLFRIEFVRTQQNLPSGNQFLTPIQQLHPYSSLSVEPSRQLPCLPETERTRIPMKFLRDRLQIVKSDLWSCCMLA